MQAASDNPLSHVLPHPLVTRDADFGFLTQDGVITMLSDQIVMMILAAVLLCVVFPVLMRKRQDSSEIGRMVPGKFASFVEMVCEYFRKEVAEPHLGAYADKFIKYIWSVFFFILTMNLLGMLPLGTVMPVLTGLHVGGTPTGNVWVTATLAILTGILMVFNGLRYGGKAYLAHFMPGPIYLKPLMLVVEVLGLIAKIFALAVRLFANMLAGHVLLAVLLMMILQAGSALGTGIGLGMAIPIVAGSVALNMLEIFVAFLQAFIFTYLTTLFIGMSVNVHHDEAAAH
ncbi:MAG: F0F1 ATP synthase subunit A [bacterium]|nr:F0F1 ATP synthase subunit A [bacterium]